MSEAARVRQAIIESKANDITPELCSIVHDICRRQIGSRDMQEDIGQQILCNLIKILPRLDTDRNLHNYLLSAVRQNWQKEMQKRKRERRYIQDEMDRQIRMLPVHRRSTARGEAFASFMRLNRLKYLT